MAIKDIARYTHLSAPDIERLGRELDAIRRDIEDSRGASDAAYIKRTIRSQRLLEVVGRLLILDGRSKGGWMVALSSQWRYSHNYRHSNRYAEIAVRVRALCDEYGLPYTTGSVVHQYLQTLRTIHRLALPDGACQPVLTKMPQPEMNWCSHRAPRPAA